MTDRVALAAYRQAKDDYDLAVRNYQRMAPTMTAARREGLRSELLRRRAELVRLHAALTAKVEPVAGKRGRPPKYTTPEERQAAKRAQDAAQRTKRGVNVGGPVGRPRKYATEQEAAEARRIQARDSARRLRGTKNPRGDNINRRKR